MLTASVGTSRWAELVSHRSFGLAASGGLLLLVVVLALVLVLGLAIGVVRMNRAGSNPLSSSEHVEEVRHVVEQLGRRAGPDEPLVGETSAGMRVAVTADRWWWHVSVSHPEHDASEAAEKLGGTVVLNANGVTHLRLAAPTSRRGDGAVADPGMSLRPTGRASDCGPAGRARPIEYFTSRPSD